METYLFKFSACLVVFWLVYVLFLEHQNMHRLKRFYLLGAVVSALIIPILTITHYIEPVVSDFEVSPILLPIESYAADIPIEASSIMDFYTVLWMIYGLGVLLFSIRFVINLFKMYKRISENENSAKLSLIYVLLEECRIPHSFFKYIFFNKTKFEENAIPKEVIMHEETHAKQLHSLDIILIELLQIVFWFHPLVYILKHHIKLNHEFLADQAVLEQGSDTKVYQNILLQFSSNTQDYQLSSAINYSSIKKRFTVMKTQTSKTRIWLSSLLLLPIIAILFYSFAEREYVEKDNIAESSEFAETNSKSNLFLVAVEKNENSIELKCESGCKWSHLILEPSSEPYIINDYGFSEGKTIDTDKFTFTIKPNQSGVELSGLKGTAWIDLNFSLSEHQTRAINQLGMTNISRSVQESNNQTNDLRIRAEENYYTKQFFTIKNSKGQSVKKRFFELSYEDKIKWVYAYEIPYNRIDVTKSHFKEAKNSKNYIIKVDGNHISKSDLNKFKASDFITFSYTPISELAKMEEQSVLNLVTHDAYNLYVKSRVRHYAEVIADYETKVALPINEETADLKEIVSTYEFLDYHYNHFTPEIIQNNNFKAPTPIARDIVEKVNQAYLDIPILYIDVDDNLFLNNKPTSLETIQKDFNKITKFQTSELLLEANGRRIHNDFVKIIMAAIGNNLKNIGIANEQALIFDPNFKSNNIKQQNLPTKKEITDYNAWAKKIHSESKKLSSDATWYPPIDEQDLIKFSAIYYRMSAQQKKQTEEYPFQGLDLSSIVEKKIPLPTANQQKPTAKQIAAYNAWAKKQNAIELGLRIVKKKDYDYYRKIYDIMSVTQRKNAESFPQIPPPPPAPKVKKGENSNIPPPPPPPIKSGKVSDSQIEAYNNWIKNITGPNSNYQMIKKEDYKYFMSIYNLMTDEQKKKTEGIPPPPPPPPAPESTLDFVIRMAKANAKFIDSGKEISSDKAIALVKKNPKLNVSAKKTYTKQPIVYFYAKPMTIDEKGNVLPPPPPISKKQQLKEKTVRGYGIITKEDSLRETKKYPNTKARAKSLEPITVKGYSKSSEKKSLIVMVNGKAIESSKLKMTRNEFKKLKLSLPNSDIVSFKLKIPGVKTEQIEGNSISNETIKNLNLAKPDFTIAIFDIKDTKDHKIPPLIIEITD